MRKVALYGGWLLLISTAFFLFGCGSAKVEQPTPIKQEQTHTQENAPPANLIRSSKLNFQLTSSRGVTSMLYFFATDEQVNAANSSSCFAKQGDPIRSGEYSLYLSHKENDVPPKQNVPLFPGLTLDFNDKGHMFASFKDPAKKLPDLLAVYQTSSCNGKIAALFSLTPDGQQVRQVGFHTQETTKQTLFISDLKQLSPDVFQTTSYNNATGLYTRITWQWHADDFQFEATEVEETKNTA